MEDFDITGETVLVSPTRVVVYEQMVDSSDRGVWRFVFSMDTVEKTLLPWSEFTADYNAFLSGLFVRQEQDDKPAWFVAKYGGLPLKYQFTITT